MITLLELTRLRVGNQEYARLNRSFGLSTLRRRHVTVNGATVRFRFQGKGGRVEERELVDRRLATIVRHCQELPGQDLFQYVDEDGETRTVRSEDVNDYLREAAGSDDVSAKDFRTWTATVLAYRALRQVSADAEQPRRTRSNPIVEALRLTAERLGDTVAVTRSAYVHPGVLEAFEAAEPSTATRPRQDLDGPPDRRIELEVLRLLRRTNRARAARPPQVGRAAVAGRPRRARA